MAYTVTNSDSGLTVTVADGTVDQTTFSLALVGRNVSNYGEFFVRNSIRHLENFASPNAPSPSTVLEGQLWYDKSEELLRVYDGSRWKRATNIVVADIAPATSLIEGTAFFDTTVDKLKIYDGVSFKPAGYAGEVTDVYSGTTNIGSPQNYGTKLRNIFLKDSSNVDRAVLALTYVNDSASGSINQGTTTTANGKETIMAIFSDHATFTVADVTSATEGENINYRPELIAVGGIGTTINPGINLRREYDTTALALSDRALRADAAYTLNLGVVGTDGANVSATSVIHTARGYVPSTNNSFNLGSTSFRFADTHTGTLFLGNGTTGSITPAGNVTIGTDSAFVDHVYANNITVADIINFSTANLGNTSSPVLNSFFANVTATTAVTIGSGATSFSLPVSRGTTGQALVIDGSGVVSWQSLAGDIESVAAGSGLTGGGASGAVTLNVGAGSFIIVNDDNIAVDATSLNTANKVVARDASGNFIAGVITATATTARYADLAEIYASDAEYDPGTVVRLGGSAEITQTTSIEDLNVFGVISTNPAYLMNSEAEGLPVALKGRVPVKVFGKVLKGERLMSSHLPGTAMALGFAKYDPRKIIGRSLEQKDNDDLGVVEAVIGVK